MYLKDITESSNAGETFVCAKYRNCSGKFICVHAGWKSIFLSEAKRL